MDKKIIKSIIILGIVLLILLAVLLINKGNSKEEKDINQNKVSQNTEIIAEENISENEPESVKSATAYFTVKSCAEKYINYLSAKNTEVIYNLLDYDYVKEFSITIDNVYNHVENAYEDSMFKIDKMLVEDIKEDEQLYYIKGNLIEIFDGEDITYGEEKEFNLTIRINHESMTFSVIPFGYGGVFYE